MNNPKIRKQYEKCLKLLTSHYGKIGQNYKLFSQYQKFHEENRKMLNSHQNKLLSDILKGFRLSGVHLDSKKRKLFRDCQNKLAELEAKFEQNILDSTTAWELKLEKKEQLKGMPSNAIETAAEVAKSRNYKGYILTLDQPCYMAVMTYANDRALRKKVYLAYASRASNKFPVKGQWDNTKVIEEILNLRQIVSEILGFANFAEYSLATKMAKNPGDVIRFLNDLKKKAKKKSKNEISELKKYAKNKLSIKELLPWDLAFIAEKYKEENFGISQEELKKNIFQ